MYSYSLDSPVAWYWGALFGMVLVCYVYNARDVGNNVVVGGVIVIQGVKDSPIVRAYVEDYEVDVSVVPYPANGRCV